MSAISPVIVPPVALMPPRSPGFKPKRLFLTACIALSMIAPAAPAAAQAAPSALDGIKVRLEAECAAGRFSGVAVAQVSGREVFKHVCGHADWEARIPMTEDARFKIFSVTKSFTATAVLALAERGRLDIDQPVARYLPHVPEAWRGVTLRHLLTHTSGIPDHAERLLNAYVDHGKTSHADALDDVLAGLTAEQAALTTPPGQVWAYSNFGYELLAQVVAEATGRAFNEALTDMVLTPSGMSGATVELPVVQDGRLRGTTEPGLIAGYNGEPGRLTAARSLSFAQQGAGSIHANYRDLLAFSDALARGAVVSRAGQARIISEAVPISETAGYGFGWIVRTAAGQNYLQHSGGTNGFITDFARTPDGRITVIFLSNLGFTHLGTLGRDLMTALMASYPAPPATAP